MMRLSLALLAVALIGQSHALAKKLIQKERVQPKVAASTRQAPRLGVLANLRQAMEALQEGSLPKVEEGSRRNLNLQADALDLSPDLHSMLDSFQEESLSSASAEPSLEPTAAPTGEPTAALTGEPTAEPTGSPPVPSPTMAPTDNDVVSFTATQLINGVSMSDYESNRALYNLTLSETIASTMSGVSSQDVRNLDLTPPILASTIRLRMLAGDSVTATYDVSVRGANLNYDDLTSQLSEAVNDGTFDLLLTQYATANNATSLVAATSDSITTTDTSPYDSGKSDSNVLHDDAIAGIVVGTLVGCLLLGLLAWFACRPKNNQSLLDAQAAAEGAIDSEL
ncbi:hypothetical protein B484DRAFT_481555 [Ochromonadaceae sp. CCMP2298]|nr:hypothetical protein B484DRAFT_481555 [Ochromonadaceae sp. CCMP2298]|mmetsp:Transcript_30031/g.68208  ORF Transcript_30031/g.68208 Transcript_30031/m.68208 type:complete len:339 (+) Transcript_30031:67-1083(+)